MSRLASTRRTRPADVSESPCAWRRMKSWVPSSSSRCAIAVEIEGCDILTRSEARVMLPVSAVAIKYSIWRSVYLMWCYLSLLNMADSDHTLLLAWAPIAFLRPEHSRIDRAEPAHRPFRSGFH